MEPDALMKKQDGPACFKRNSATDIALSKKDCAAAQLFFRTLLDQIGITIETHNPIDLLVLMLGTNDCKTRFNASSKTIAKGLIQVIEKAKKYSSQPFELLIISPIHLGNGVGDDGFDPEFDLASEQVSRQLAQEYRKVATHYHVGFLDASKIALPSEIDREHLDESGHAALADAIYKTITESGLLEKGVDSSFCHIA